VNGVESYSELDYGSGKTSRKRKKSKIVCDLAKGTWGRSDGPSSEVFSASVVELMMMLINRFVLFVSEN
jgi:hypothetical protein